ncbi:hypothetical protein BDW62DRAFT_36 [Aspergillus aurantiobrunneus]
MRVAVFPVQTLFHIRANGKLIGHKISNTTFTRRNFNIHELEEALYETLEKCIRLYKFRIKMCTVCFKQESGRGGTKYYNLEDFSIPATEEILKHMEDFRNMFTEAARMIWTWELYIKYNKNQQSAAVDAVTAELPLATGARAPSSSIPSSPPQLWRPIQSLQRTRGGRLGGGRLVQLTSLNSNRQG